MKLQNLLCEVDEGLAVLTVNRPHALNALNKELLSELESLLKRLDDDGTVKAVILTGAGDKAFVAGGDIKEMAAMPPL